MYVFFYLNRLNNLLQFSSIFVHKPQIFKYIICISEFKMLSARVYSNIGKRRCKLHTYLTCSETEKDEERKNGKKLQITADQKNEQMIEGSAPQPAQPIPGGSWWKNPIYYNPVVPPLERGPDFSFLDGRRPTFTSKFELERRQRQVQLGRQIVVYLSELREAEQLYGQQKMEKAMQREQIQRGQLKQKGMEEIF